LTTEGNWGQHWGQLLSIHKIVVSAMPASLARQ
jgi:hypothetical protein